MQHAPNVLNSPMLNYVSLSHVLCNEQVILEALFSRIQTQANLFTEIVKRVSIWLHQLNVVLAL